jgi:hypothetical protein
VHEAAEPLEVVGEREDGSDDHEWQEHPAHARDADDANRDGHREPEHRGHHERAR